MVIPTPDQGIPQQQGGDPANLPGAQVSQDGVIEPRLFKQYANDADRVGRNAAPPEGQVWHLAAEDRNEQWDGVNPISLYRRSLFHFVRRTTDATAIASNTTLANDATLVTVLPAVTGVFKFRDTIIYSSSQTADYKIAYTFPGTGWWGGIGLATTATATTGDAQFAVTTASGTAAAYGGANVGTRLILIVDGEITLTGVGGNLQLQYAQNASDASNTIPAYTGSCREVWRVS